LATPIPDEPPTQRLDRLLHAAAAQFTGGLSPVSLALAVADWAWHLGVSPGRQMELAALGAKLLQDTLQTPQGDSTSHRYDDPRLGDAAWAQWPFNQLRAGILNAEVFWREASATPGMTSHHRQMTQFFAQQWLSMLSPANGLSTNPVLLRDAVDSGGRHLAQGVRNLVADVTGVPTPEDAARPVRFQVGKDVAVTPGKVVHRNRLVELIRYEPQTETVYPEPVFIIPSWIMKYYILDLSPHNSMVRYLVSQGHTVYMLSWRNPDASDHDLTMDDYLRLGVLDVLQTIARLGGDSGNSTPVHAMGYCLGGTLLAMAAAALGKRPQPAVMGYSDLPPLATVTMLAAQTDFSEPGELGLFIDESQVNLLDHITRGQGFLSGKQMAGSFQFLHARDLLWARMMHEYLLGERDQPNDLMSWNADTTRIPARMHNDYLVSLYLKNALASSRYLIDGRPVSLADIRKPVFVVGTEKDHVSPWRSVYKLHHLCDTEITFVLTSGGHNAGIISEPGHAHRSYRIATRAQDSAWIAPEDWLKQASAHEGSWWTDWHTWLAAHSSPMQAASAIPAWAVLSEAPGSYVFQCYPEP
jgi:polyhydroxyalkanoate synthase